MILYYLNLTFIRQYLGIGGFIYTPRPSQEFLEERHKIDSTYSARSDSLHKDYQTQLNNLEEKFD